MDVLDSEKAAGDSFINHDGDALDLECGSGLVGEVVTEEVEDMQKALKYYYL